jgi:hypothetical protein
MKNSKIDKLITDLTEEIKKEHTYGDKGWKRSHWNQPGIYDVRLNFQQIMMLDIAVKQKRGRKDTVYGMPYPVHLKKKWNTKVREIYQDYKERRESK